MTTLETLEKKKKTVKDALEGVAHRIFNKRNYTTIIKEIADKLEVSAPTVKNYMTGSVNDGYLAEAILTELKKIK